MSERNIPTRVGRRRTQRLLGCRRKEHPHAGGEKDERAAEEVGEAGTSPRGWGEGDAGGEDVVRRRNIPTRVGRSVAYAPPPTRSPEHPHAGGEKLLRENGWTYEVGTSPRGWGEARHEKAPPPRNRNIPTRVGRSVSVFIFSFLVSEHPHAGGEKNRTPVYVLGVLGTSPRGWGEVPDSTTRLTDARNIPTRVGRRLSAVAMARTTAEHPHAGGEK